MPLLEVRSVTKTFSGVPALKDVSFELSSGEVHALVGENGAGKSTLIKVITGAVKPDSGSVFISGQLVEDNNPHVSRALGVAAIYQQPSLFPDLSVAENIALTLETGGVWRLVSWKARKRRAAQLIETTGASIDPERLAGTLSMPEQQIVEICKAIGAQAKIVIMDEPTASLTDREVRNLFQVIADLRGNGAGVIYISHRLEEIAMIAGRITVLRDGRIIDTCPAQDVSRAQLIQMMVGREVAPVSSKPKAEARRVAIEVRSLGNTRSGLHDISFTVQAGEVVGFAGLVGSGRTEMAETLFGLTPATSGQVLLDGLPVRIGSPAEAIRAGVAYVPEDRRRHGIVPEMSISANVSLANLKAVSRYGLLEERKERDLANRWIQQLRIKTPSAESVTANLSGGNQQKVALARWLSTSPKILIVDEPTQGVDVGAKAEIHSLIQESAASGLAIILISSEMPEVLSMSDRIIVMRQGTIAGVLSREEATQEAILSLTLAAA